MNRFVTVLAIVAVVVLSVFWYKHRAKTRALGSGEVYVRDQPSAPPTPLAASTPPPPANNQIATTATPQPLGPPASLPQAAPPQGDSIPRNPPNGLAFAGAGKFQLYRQGDITWRLDTQTGDACILFATDAQWRHPRVFQSGCGTRGETSVTTGD